MGIKTLIDDAVGIQGFTGYLVIIFLAYLGYMYLNKSEENFPRHKNHDEEEEEDEPSPPRNFTMKQLRQFNGKADANGVEKGVYLSLNGIVFDVNKGKEFYGPGGPYESFAGRECGVALAKMSFDEGLLDDIAGCEKLSFGEKDELDNWMQKFEHYRSYPIVGRLVPDSALPDPNQVLSKEEISKYDGKGEVPTGYAAAPIYIGVEDKVFDASFGGVTFYGPDCPYESFAGKDASRALAKMSFNPDDITNTSTDDLTEKEVKVLKDWAKTFGEKKDYPVVGILKK